MLSGQGAQCEEALLDLFERARVEFESARGAAQRFERLGGFGSGALGGGDGIVEQALRPVAGAVKPP